MDITAREKAIVSRILSAEDQFTMRIIKPIKFKSEGSTANSLFNARMIKEAGYRYIKGNFTYDLNAGNWKLEAFFERDDGVASHDFKGFSFNYGGEGPSGLVEFGNIFGLRFNKNKILVHGESGLPESGTVDLLEAFS